MKFKISDAYIQDSEKIKSFIDQFEETGEVLSGGKRNLIKTFELNGQRVNIKSFKIPNIVNKIIYRFFRKSKAERSYYFASYLISKDIGTPYPIAYAESYSGFAFKDSYYVSQHLEYDITYRELITKPEYPERDFILREFTKFTYRLHESGILFKDHSPGNTLIKKENGEFHFYLVDLNRMEFKVLSTEDRIKNFSRLTPKEDMVRTMSETYADLINEDPEKVFRLMWRHTEAFQYKYHRKRRWKKRILFWRK